MQKKLSRSLAFGAVVAAVILGSGSASAEVSKELIAKAKAEGEVVWYTTMVVDQVVRPVAAAFESQYGIKVSFVTGGWRDVALRVSNEAKAGSVKGDVYDSSEALGAMLPDGLVEAYRPQSAANFPDDLKDKDGYWTAAIMQPMVAAVNTDMVEEADYPKTFEDLLDPKWKGQMAWTNNPTLSGPVGFIGAVLETMGEDKGMDYLKKLAQQKIANVPSNQRVVLDQAIAGQYPLVLSVYNYHVAISQDKGAPIKPIHLDVSQMNTGMAGMLKGAPHPNAAKLFLEYFYSEAGQKIAASAGYIPVSPDVKAKHPELNPLAGKFKVISFSPTNVGDKPAHWLDIYKTLFE
ncbi:extracellular solute-binding protein [Rhizobium lusitanum]|uniref:Extracellular solute-binding protein n=1 Tax=Rhizobium lusitanum TaxID=293958 RepID=A0A6L9UC23_9HYPH|nr:extracellular solute-binding protein [Rhizobium lusitanum]NEI73144.1 extracellular solute-binding protein [Rhizobium lusitanum]